MMDSMASRDVHRHDWFWGCACQRLDDDNDHPTGHVSQRGPDSTPPLHHTLHHQQQHEQQPRRHVSSDEEEEERGGMADYGRGVMVGRPLRPVRQVADLLSQVREEKAGHDHTRAPPDQYFTFCE